jgi:hypothetical protein
MKCSAVDVGAAVHAELEPADVRVGAVGDRLVPLQAHARVAAVDVHVRPDRHGDVVDAASGLDLADLVQPAPIALAAVERRREERAGELGGELVPHDLGAEAEDVHVVVLDALVRRVDVVADARADPVELARRDRCPHARAADEDAALGRA